MDAVYARKSCKGACTILDDLQMCMGLCNTDDAYVKVFWEDARKKYKKAGVELPYLEGVDDVSLSPTKKLDNLKVSMSHQGDTLDVLNKISR